MYSISAALLHCSLLQRRYSTAETASSYCGHVYAGLRQAVEVDTSSAESIGCIVGRLLSSHELQLVCAQKRPTPEPPWQPHV